MICSLNLFLPQFHAAMWKESTLFSFFAFFSRAFPTFSQPKATAEETINIHVPRLFILCSPPTHQPKVVINQMSENYRGAQEVGVLRDKIFKMA